MITSIQRRRRWSRPRSDDREGRAALWIGNPRIKSVEAASARVVIRYTARETRTPTHVIGLVPCPPIESPQSADVIDKQFLCSAEASRFSGSLLLGNPLPRTDDRVAKSRARGERPAALRSLLSLRLYDARARLWHSCVPARHETGVAGFDDFAVMGQVVGGRGAPSSASRKALGHSPNAQTPDRW